MNKYFIILFLLILTKSTFGQSLKNDKHFDNYWNNKSINFEINFDVAAEKHRKGILLKNLDKLTFGEVVSTPLMYDKTDTLYSVLFKNKTSFGSTTFNKSVDISSSKFMKSANFSDAIFNEDANFSFVDFANILIFDGATFKKTPNFTFTHMPDTLWFSNVNLKECLEPIRFDGAFPVYGNIDENNKRCKIFFNSSIDFNKIVLDASRFELGFFEYMEFEEKLVIYEQVIKKCKEMGMQESIAKFDKELQKLKIRHQFDKKLRFSILQFPFTIFGESIIFIKDYWWGFGYEKDKIYRNILISWLICLCLFFYKLPYFSSVYFPTQNGISSLEASKIPLMTLKRLKVSIFYTSLIFFSWKIEHEKINYMKHPWGALLIYVVFLLGIIHLAYLAGAILA